MEEKIINIKQELIDVYLDWMNNFISIPAFADYYGLSEKDAKVVLDLGRKYHEQKAKYMDF